MQQAHRTHSLNGHVDVAALCGERLERSAPEVPLLVARLVRGRPLEADGAEPSFELRNARCRDLVPRVGGLALPVRQSLSLL